MNTTPLLEVRELEIVFTSHHTTTTAVRGIEFDIAAGEVLGIVGESGSGKSVTSFAIAGLLSSPPATISARTMSYQGTELSTLAPSERRAMGGREIAMVYQDALSALNPVLTIGRQLELAIRHHAGLGRAAARRRAIDLLQAVEIPDAARRIDDYPHQFSGGQRQRVLIAIALCNEPALLIADEPTTALDVTVQAQIIDLVSRLAHDRAMAVIWVTHDLGVVARIANRVAVMRAGRIVEHAATAELFREPRHPYTQALLGAIPRLDAIPTPSRPRRRLSEAATQDWVEGHPEGTCDRESCLLSVPATGAADHDWACFVVTEEAGE